MISTGAPQGCVLSPLLFSLYTSGCTSKDTSAKLLKFADDTTLIGLIQDGPAEAVLPSTVEEDQPATATKSDLRRLRRVAWTAERIIDATLPTLQKLYSSRVWKRSGKIPLDPSHPAHSLFELLPSGRRYRALSTRTTRHRKFLSPSSHEYLILNMEHTTILYNYLFTTQTLFFI